MAKTLPASIVVPGHPDFATLSAIRADLERRAGGPGRLAAEVPALLREVIDDVIQTPRTGRRSYAELEKTEKTYIGTRVEIMLRALLKLPRGRLDTRVAGHDTDIKHTMTGNWMIPQEAVGHPCILVAADEDRARCALGLVVARPEYLTAGANRDAKRSIARPQFQHILWIFADHPYPPNFWRTVPPDAVERIFTGNSGNARVMALFREVRGVPISRETVEAVARQKDFMRRIRSDDGRGTRDRLAAEGILLLSGTYDGPLIRRLGLPLGDFVSYRPTAPDELAAARAAGWRV
ncbi:NaeI family type II restriction endonuclease [Tabrizicola thermarum]|uniref:NaeI family type II restriction endonuclease n=1 Tax=Tabrizicola thermarum TaxID=2670345 RepID=UPI000FFB6D30|nr:NaeI family type II restriction endonuclease [Tabrizicola thermarum]